MPLYEYRCEACGRPEEKLESLSAPGVHACPDCGATEGMRRQVSVAAFSLSGGGWYKSAAAEPAASAAKTETPKPEAPKGCHGCAAGGCGCPLAG